MKDGDGDGDGDESCNYWSKIRETFTNWRPIGLLVAGVKSVHGCKNPQ